MTGWLRIRDIGSSVFKLHKLPGGPWLGSIMLFAAIFTTVADLSVNVLIQTTQVVTRCSFSTGVVISTKQQHAWDPPPPLGYPALIASNAQINSVLNGGPAGIYGKANNDLNFRADPYRDMMSYWQCEKTSNQTYTNSSQLSDQQDIIDSLISLGILYDNDDGETPWNWDAEGTAFTHLILWTASIASNSTGVFEVKAAIEEGGSYDGDINMMGYHCSLYTLDGDQATIPGVMNLMTAHTTLAAWVPSLQTMIYDGYKSNANYRTAFWIAQTLNTIVMVEGGDDLATSLPLDTDTPDQGCLIYTGWISPFIFVLVAIAALALGLMIVYYILLNMRLGVSILFNRGAGSETGVKAIPSDLIGWILHATRESALGEQHGTPVNLAHIPEKASSINEWEYQPIVDGNVSFGKLVRMVGSPSPVQPLMRQESLPQQQPQSLPQQQLVGGQDVGYGPVGIPWEGEVR